MAARRVTLAVAMTMGVIMQTLPVKRSFIIGDFYKQIDDKLCSIVRIYGRGEVFLPHDDSFNDLAIHFI